MEEHNPWSHQRGLDSGLNYLQNMALGSDMQPPSGTTPTSDMIPQGSMSDTSSGSLPAEQTHVAPTYLNQNPYEGLISAVNVPPVKLPKGVQPIHVEILTDTTIRFGDSERPLTLDTRMRYLFNVFVFNRGMELSDGDIRKLDPVHDGFYGRSDMPGLEHRIEDGVVELERIFASATERRIITRSADGSRYALNPAITLMQPNLRKRKRSLASGWELDDGLDGRDDGRLQFSQREKVRMRRELGRNYLPALHITVMGKHLWRAMCHGANPIVSESKLNEIRATASKHLIENSKGVHDGAKKSTPPTPTTNNVSCSIVTQ